MQWFITGFVITFSTLIVINKKLEMEGADK